jgi:Ni,Fe-hydrogenase I large subunit
MKSLKLTSSLVSQIDNSHLVDTLPYIDSIPDSLKHQASELLSEELKTFLPKDYLKDYPKDFQSFELIEIQDFRVPLIAQSENEYDLLSLSKSHEINLEYLQNEKMNLQLLNEFTESSYKKHLECLESVNKKLDYDLKQEELRSLTINKDRKISQESKKNELKSLQGQFDLLIVKNHQLSKKLSEKKKLLESLEFSDPN